MTSAKDNDVIVLGYWKIRGLGQPIRFLLEYAELPYREDRYQIGPAPDYDRSEWTTKKNSLGLAFPNLPYLFHGEVKLTESRAILTYIGKLKSLCGDSIAEQAYHDMLLNVLGDFARTLGSIAYNSDYAHLLVTVRQSDMPKVFTQLSAYLGKRPFLLGDKPSPADFVLYEQLVVAQAMVPDALTAFAVIEQFKQRVESLPAIAAYLRSDRYLARPINNAMATFGAR